MRCATAEAFATAPAGMAWFVGAAVVEAAGVVVPALVVEGAPLTGREELVVSDSVFVGVTAVVGERVT